MLTIPTYYARDAWRDGATTMRSACMFALLDFTRELAAQRDAVWNELHASIAARPEAQRHTQTTTELLLQARADQLTQHIAMVFLCCDRVCANEVESDEVAQARLEVKP